MFHGIVDSDIEYETRKTYEWTDKDLDELLAYVDNKRSSDEISVLTQRDGVRYATNKPFAATSIELNVDSNNGVYQIKALGKDEYDNYVNYNNGFRINYSLEEGEGSIELLEDNVILFSPEYPYERNIIRVADKYDNFIFKEIEIVSENGFEDIKIENITSEIINEEIVWESEVRGEDLLYHWRIYKDGKIVYSDSQYTVNNSQLRYRYEKPGIYTARLNVKNRGGNRLDLYCPGLEIKDLNIKIENITSEIINEEIIWESEVRGEDLLYHWRIYKDGKIVYSDSQYTVNNSQLRYRYEKPGIYTARLNVKNRGGNRLDLFSRELSV